MNTNNVVFMWVLKDLWITIQEIQVYPTAVSEVDVLINPC